MRSFKSYVANSPSRIAIIGPDGAEISYAELDRRVDQVSRLLDSMGAKRGDVVSALIPNIPEALIVQRAVIRRPLYYSPVNWHLAPAEIAYILGDSAPIAVFTSLEFKKAAQDALDAADIPRERLIVVDAPAEDFDSLAALTASLVGSGSTETTGGARRLYTSGTTGRPKAVLRPLPSVSPDQAAQAGVVRAGVYDMDHENGVYLNVAPLYHAAPAAYSDQAFDLGHTVVISPKWNARNALDLIRRHGVTYSYMVPLMMQDLLSLPAVEREGVNTLRTIVHTAAPCPPHVKRAMIDWLGPILTEVYGGTEGSATSIRSAEWLQYPGSVGRPREGVRLEIRNDEGELLPTGEIGHIYYANPSLAFVYDKDAEKTAASRIGDAVTLGDIGYVNEDGYLFLCDRVADLVISGGVNIYPAEIENALKELDLVADACVIGVPDSHWGESVHAVVVLNNKNADANRDDLSSRLQEQLRQKIAGFKVPRTFDFVSQLPYSEAGKLQRRQVRERVLGELGFTAKPSK